MTKVLVTAEYLHDAANAIRTKLGTSSAYKPAQMASAIASIDGGGEDAIQAADMPDYVKAAALEVARKVAAVQTSSTITFIAMSDAHDLLTNTDIRNGLKHAGMAAKAIGYMVPLDFFFHGGDATMGGASTTLADGTAEIAEVNQWIDEAAEGVPNFRTPGNHDALRYNTGITPLTDAELYQYFGRYNADGTTVMGSTTAGYCHRDIAAKQCRIICLNTAEGAKENVSTAQQLWFAQKLASVPSGYGVVILSHHPLDWSAINPCANILYQFSQKGSCTVGGTTVSFASVNPAYTVCFHGHVHNFLAARVNRVQNSTGTPFDVMRIATPNVCFNRNNEYWQNGQPEYFGIEFGEPTTYNKTAGTANDTAFVVNVIDPTNEMVHSFCYGAGRDRAVGIGGTIYHAVSATLSHVTSSNASTSIEDGTSYTTTLAAESGYDLQSVTVIMGGTDITSTAYNSSTGVVSIASVTGYVSITATAIIHSSVTNLVPTAVDYSGNVVGYKDGYYVASNGVVGEFTAAAGFTATGAMALPSGWQHIYVKGVPMLQNDSHERYFFANADKSMSSNAGYYINSTNYASADMTIETLGTNYYRISSTNANTLACSWVCMSFKTASGANLVISVDEPIE